MQNTAQEQWPIFVVEFKAGRIDYFYNPVKSSVLSSGTTSGDSAVSTSELAAIRIGDLVIVEADRGKDLGKVICDSIMNAAQLQQFRSQHRNVMLDAHADREVHPKRIFKLAYPNEIAMLVAKSQDEAKATAVCQTKIRQRKLPMEVVDAEYQWDRRKLTFYFVAESRIDFRDLVKDLFKVYKTRIWMCAVDPAKVVR
ncbi:PSP1 C-terminal conserved region-domain-containing protein [Zopfochytrium polystomum]|nr:PSP1 C-terminal conserved region-domain-containing protein [Zopfochytrium polystomum]